MSIRTTITLDDDVIERVKDESRLSGASFRDTLNNLLRVALLNTNVGPSHRSLKIEPTPMGQVEGLNYDDVESLLEFGEGESER